MISTFFFSYNNETNRSLKSNWSRQSRCPPWIYSIIFSWILNNNRPASPKTVYALLISGDLCFCRCGSCPHHLGRGREGSERVTICEFEIKPCSRTHRFLSNISRNWMQRDATQHSSHPADTDQARPGGICIRLNLSTQHYTVNDSLAFTCFPSISTTPSAL